MALAESVTTVVTHADGLRFDARIRGHVVTMDQPLRGGGTDTAPSPLELLDAALGGCIALYIHQFCASRGLPVAGLRVLVGTARAAAGPRRVGRFTVTVELPAGIPADALPMIERVVRTCPVHNTLEHPPEIAVELCVPAEAEA
jgi:putative redox protein